MIKKCSNCKNTVSPIKKDFSWGIFIFLGLLTGFIIYPLYRVLFVKKDICPVCGLTL